MENKIFIRELRENQYVRNQCRRISEFLMVDEIRYDKIR